MAFSKIIFPAWMIWSEKARARLKSIVGCMRRAVVSTCLPNEWISAISSAVGMRTASVIGSGWTAPEVVDATPTAGQHSSLALDDAGHPHVTRLTLNRLGRAGVEAIVAEGFERIHRTNLVGMGVLPLEFKPGENRHTYAIDGTETFDVVVLAGHGSIVPRRGWQRRP